MFLYEKTTELTGFEDTAQHMKSLITFDNFTNNWQFRIPPILYGYYQKKTPQH